MIQQSMQINPLLTSQIPSLLPMTLRYYLSRDHIYLYRHQSRHISTITDSASDFHNHLFPTPPSFRTLAIELQFSTGARRVNRRLGGERVHRNLSTIQEEALIDKSTPKLSEGPCSPPDTMASSAEALCGHKIGKNRTICTTSAIKHAFPQGF